MKKMENFSKETGKEPNGNFRTKKYNNQNLRGSLEKLSNRMERTEEIISHQEHRTA